MKSSSPRKQRLSQNTLPLHKRKSLVSVHLVPELRKQYNTRSIPARKGDTVKVIKGKFKGTIGKVSSVSLDSAIVCVEGVSRNKTDGTKVFAKICPSNLVMTQVETKDPKRLEALARCGKSRGVK